MEADHDRLDGDSGPGSNIGVALLAQTQRRIGLPLEGEVPARDQALVLIETPVPLATCVSAGPMQKDTTHAGTELGRADPAGGQEVAEQQETSKANEVQADKDSAISSTESSSTNGTGSGGTSASSSTNGATTSDATKTQDSAQEEQTVASVSTADSGPKVAPTGRRGRARAARTRGG